MHVNGIAADLVGADRVTVLPLNVVLSSGCVVVRPMLRHAT